MRLVIGRSALALVALAVMSSAEEYDIGPQDVLRIAVLGQPEMSGEFSVDQAGMVEFPFLGTIKASEMRPKEFEKKLTTLLADGYLKRPQVAVTVKEYRSQRVYVTGEVSRAGPYALRSDRKLLSLLADLGPLGTNVGHEVVVTRPPKPEPLPLLFEIPPDDALQTGDILPKPVPADEVFRKHLRDLQLGKPEADLVLEPGDTVFFPKASSVYLAGHVARPGAYRYEEGMTVMQALNQAGGATERGAVGRVKLVRFVDGKRVEMKANPLDVVQPEDTIVVPERFF
jgi:polysaccharide export outer membrane protein